MKKLTPRRRINTPRRPLARLLDRLTPARLRVYYGPDGAARWGPEGCRYSWGCNRCLRRGRQVDSAGFTRTLIDARAEAEMHAGEPRHFGMRVVYDPEG